MGWPPLSLLLMFIIRDHYSNNKYNENKRKYKQWPNFLFGGLSLFLSTPMRIDFHIPVDCKDLFLNVVLVKTANYNSGLNRYYGHSTGNE